MTHPLTCRELVELVTDYLELALPEEERRRFEEHLHGCVDCQSYVAQIRQTAGLVGRLGDAPLPAEQRDRLLELFRRWREHP